MTKSWTALPFAFSLVLFVSCVALAQEAPSNQVSRSGAKSAETSSLERSSSESYRRWKDPEWYARQLHLLRRELAQVDMELKTLVQARKYGKSGTDSVALDQEAEGVTTEGQMYVLQARRTQLLGQIDELEEQARHNIIDPGELRSEYEPGEPAHGYGRNANGPTHNASRTFSREAKALENSLAEEKENQQHAQKEAELLRRDRELKSKQEYSNPEPLSRKSRALESVRITRFLAEKEAEVNEREEKIAEIEDRLQNLRRSSAAQRETDAGAAAESESANHAPENNRENDEKDETYWRKQFAAVDYKIRIAKTELDILQRELNLGLVQFYPNPTTAMKESITRREINEHRKAIEDKKKEVTDLKRQREDLEDALRHAGGPAGWARQ